MSILALYIILAWFVVTATGIVVVGFNLRDARADKRAVDAANSREELRELARHEVRQQWLYLIVFIAHFVAGVVVYVGQVTDQPFRRWFPVALVVGELIMMGASLHERRARLK